LPSFQSNPEILDKSIITVYYENIHNIAIPTFIQMVILIYAVTF